MKHTFIGNTLSELSDIEINVLQVALTHSIEELEDDNNFCENDWLFKELKTAKQLYLDLGGKRFWQLKMTEEDAKKLNKAIHGKKKNDHRS